MNRNTESYFSELPDIQLSRSTFDLSTDHKFTGNVGRLIPFYCEEVLPGDTFNVTTSKVVRLQTLLAPIMDNLYLDTYFFFVPNRLVWDHWREFMGENTESAWLQPVEYQVPVINCIAKNYYTDPNDDAGVLEGSVFDYFGVPINVLNVEDGVRRGLKINALPIRAYSLIWSEFFRDENIMDPVNLYTGDAERTIFGMPGAYPAPSEGERNMWCWPVSRYHDYFSSCLPAPQKGPDVMIPMDSIVPVGTGPESHLPLFRDPVSNHGYQEQYQLVTNDESVHGIRLSNTDFVSSGGSMVLPNNLWAQLDNMTLSTINNLRLAFQVQKLYEKDARGGTRYIEMLRSHFGVVSSDARLQRPEYLGGNRIGLNVNQVTNTSQSEAGQAFLGDLGAFSHTADVHSDFIKSFEEHGFVIGVCCVRYDHTYSQGLERFWSRRTRFDYYWPVFANIGEQPVLRREIYAKALDNDTADTAVFGYQEAWADYRYKPNRVSAEMRPQAAQSLATWNLADDYSGPPVLSPDWMFESKSNVDRVLAVTSEVSNQILFDIYVQNRATRAMPVHSIPGLADHH